MPQVPQEVGHLKNFEKTKKKRTPESPSLQKAMVVGILLLQLAYR